MLRWIKRIAFGLLAVVSIAIVAAIVFFNTDYGRETLRVQVATQLNGVFAHGVTIRKIEGTPFGELVLRDVVINGPDHKPAIAIGNLRLRMRLIDLLANEIQLGDVVAEDVDVEARRDAQGNFHLAELLRPRPASTRSFELPAIEVHRAHLLIETGSADLQVVNLDGLEATANLHVPASGPWTASLALAATWRERGGTPVALTADVRKSVEMLALPKLAISVGGMSLAAADVELVLRAGRLPLASGSVHVAAPAAAVAMILPRLQLPADLAVSVSATRGAVSAIAVTGAIGATPIHADLVADVDRLHATGKLVTGELDLGLLTRGRIVATAGGTVDFDIAPGAPGMLPTATLGITGHGTFGDLPQTDVTASIASHGNRIATRLGVTGATRATVVAELERAGEVIVLERGSIVGTTPDAAVASGGRVPIHGAIAVDLTAHGQLSPSPRLAVAGTITGSHLRVQDVSVASARIALDATELPGRPHGKATMQLVGLARGEVQLGALTVDAATRADERIAVTIVSHPPRAPWLVEVGALVTPPARDGTIVVDVLAHHVHAGDGSDWRGTAGRVLIGPEHVEVLALASTGPAGRVAISGSYLRAGHHAGDLRANVDVTGGVLAALHAGYAGTLEGHVEAERTAGLWSGHASASGAGLSLVPGRPPVGLTAKISVLPGTVTVAATVSSPGVGSAQLALDLAAPARVDSVQAWRQRDRAAIRSAQLRVQDVDLGKLAAIVAPDQTIAGRLDGELDLTATTISGALHLRKLATPALRGTGAVDADLVLAQRAPDELDPTLTVAIAGLGKLVASAQLALPARVLDPDAWRHLGPAALRGAQLQTERIVVDAALLDRLGIASSLRGMASLRAEIGAGARTATLTGDLLEVRGAPLAQPVTAHVVVGLDGTAATAAVDVTTVAHATPLLRIDARVPMSPGALDRLLSDRSALVGLPLIASLTLVQTSAPQLLALFGRGEVTGGTLEGKIDIAGTVGKPTLHARVVASALAVPPGPGGTPVQKVERLALDATWAEGRGTLTLDGTEDHGGKLALRVQGSPRELAAATATLSATSFNVTPLLAFAPGPAGASRGTLDAELKITGLDLRTAQLLGELHVKHGRIPIAPTIGTLRQASIDLAVHEHDIAIAATGKLGAGDVKLAGSIGLDSGSLTGGAATITLRKVSPIGAVQPIIDADVTAKVERKEGTWMADLVVDHGFVKIASSSGEALKPVGLPADLVVGRGAKAPSGPRPPPARPLVVAHITLHDTQVESAEFRTTLRGELTATADAKAIGMVGEIEAVGGDLDLFDRRYNVETAAATFDGTTDPLIRVRFTHDFPDVETITEVNGRLSKPRLVLTSNPGTYTKGQLLGFLLGGEPSGDPTSAGARDKATAAGESLVASKIGDYVKKALPFDIDVIRYEAAGATSSAAITVGSWVTHTLFLAYRQRLGARPDENLGEATVQYWFTKRLEIEGTAGDRSYDGLDLLWRRRF